MTWTYSGDPSASDRDKVRFLVGDTQTADQLVTDEEIAWLLSEASGVYPAAVMACESIAAQFARLADTQVDDGRVSLSQRAKGYRDLAATLRSRVAVSSVSLFAGGISISDKQTAESDTDRVPPIFTRDMHVVSHDGALAIGDDD